MDEKVRQGWQTGHAPYGYINVDDRNEPVQPDPVKSKTMMRIFELYSLGNLTFEALADRLAEEGHIYRETMPRFHRTALSYILNNRFYIGELHRNGQVFQGKYRRIVERDTFDAYQDILNGKNRRTGSPDLPYSGGLFTCAYCGQMITGERIRRKLRCGGVREHIYYRCANNNSGPDHPTVRWRECDLELAIVKDLNSLRFPTPELAAWFRKSLTEAFADVATAKQRQLATLTKRKSELTAMKDRLLNAYLAGTIDDATYTAKSDELKGEATKAEETIERLNGDAPIDAALGLRLFDWSQNVADLWLGSNITQEREILDLLSLNRTLSDVSLVLAKRKPFGFLAERLISFDSRGDRI